MYFNGLEKNHKNISVFRKLLIKIAENINKYIIKGNNKIFDDSSQYFLFAVLGIEKFLKEYPKEINGIKLSHQNFRNIQKYLFTIFLSLESNYKYSNISSVYHITKSLFDDDTKKLFIECLIDADRNYFIDELIAIDKEGKFTKLYNELK